VAFLGELAPPDFVQCVQLAEQLGYESAWMAEGRCGDQFSILTACALATSHIKLGTSITSVFVRTPTTIGMAAATVDYFSGGRFMLGVGSDHRAQVGPMHGGVYDQPMQRLRETVDVVRQLWATRDVEHHGTVIDIELFPLWFEPLRPEIPIFVAGVQPKMLQLAGEISSGAMSTWHTVEQAREARAYVNMGAARVGKGPDEVELAQMIPCYVSDDADVAREYARRRAAFKAFMLPRYRMRMEEAGFAREINAVRDLYAEGRFEEAVALVPRALVEAFALVGTPDDAHAQLQRFREAGVTLPMLSLRTPPQIPMTRRETVDLFCETIRACAPR
jgi:alkanesulfonate monooxygenase SsuD/methylene tetrahydromethanopterin reductase-like flavin-dependent oxidoreductase (luciferase family)